MSFVFSFSYFLLLVFPPSFPQWRSGCDMSSAGDFQERRPLIVDEDEDFVQNEKERGGMFV